MRVALYARVSTDDKGQDPELQLVPMREHVAARGWELVGEYVDHASAKDLRGRRRWRALLEDARAHQVELVMVWNWTASPGRLWTRCNGYSSSTATAWASRS